MPPRHHNPISAFYRALAPLGRWPRWLLIGIVLYSLVVMLALVGYALTGPSVRSLDAALGNILFVWAAGFVPAAILFLILLARARPLMWRSWGLRLLLIGMIGIFVAALWIASSLSAVHVMSRSQVAWGMVLLTAGADVAVFGLILLVFTPLHSRRWSTWLWAAAMIAFVVCASYQAIASAIPSTAVPVVVQATNTVQSVAYFAAIVSLLAIAITTLRARRVRPQASQRPPAQ